MREIRLIAVGVLLVLLSVGCSTTLERSLERPLYSIDCDDLGSYASKFGDEKYVAKFLNSKDIDLDMYWIDYKGEEVLYGSISPGETWAQNTYVTHPWVARDKSGVCVAAFTSRSTGLVEIR